MFETLTEIADYIEDAVFNTEDLHLGDTTIRVNIQSILDYVGCERDELEDNIYQLKDILCNGTRTRVNYYEIEIQDDDIVVRIF